MEGDAKQAEVPVRTPNSICTPFFNCKLKYTWNQTLSEVTLHIPVPQGTRGKDVNCKITPTRLVIGLKLQEKPLVEVS